MTTYLSPSIQHPFITDFNERQVRIQIKDQIDRMKRKKSSDEYEYSGSDEEGGSLDPPTVRKQGDGQCWAWLVSVQARCFDPLHVQSFLCTEVRSGAAALSPTRVSELSVRCCVALPPGWS